VSRATQLFRLATVGMLAAALVGGLNQAAGAQATNLASVTMTINPVGTPPPGLTGYRIDLICRGVAGIVAPGNQTLTAGLGVAGGSVTLQLAVQTGTACQFRLTAQGTGPRPINGNGAFVGGTARAVTFPTTVGGVAVDPNTVMETVFIPIESSTEAVFGTLTPVTTTTSTTVAATTSTSTTSTTRPATTVVTTLPPPPPPATTVKKPTTTVKVVTKVILRDRKCKSGYRFSRSRCLTTAERKKYVR
jgi:hypothetical protein